MRTNRCLTLALTIAACGHEPSPPLVETTQSPLRALTSDEQTVTLITGDRVTIRNGAPVVMPGPGRTQIKFAIETDHDHVRVVPDDVASLIAADQVDISLFDVTLLLASGYGDHRRDDLPLLVTRVASAPSFARRAGTGVTIDRALPMLRTVAMRQSKLSGGAALGTVRAAGAPVKLWLDRIRKPLLDHSVPQIGGTAAHARGLTGTGVTVAVLDTGIDSTHPDLAGKVVVAEDFTGDGQGMLDVVGHGTHVASIIAGTGAASNGQFAGVAPDAHLVSGRVCNLFGCPDSAILAGMAWAAGEQHARIINLSLGGTDTPGIDPLEGAVNQLSAEFGALFVIAAGNDGFAGSIESPGSADAAITVGAVDRDDQLAFFSSRGPRTGDHAIKPDLTAPGVDIVAARASGVPPIGTPVGTSYMQLSGTSMATPHVSGSAALLLQQHPDWTGAQLKAQLTASANPSPDLTAFDQGSGRVDVDRGTRQDVSTDPASLSFGIASFPHDDDPLIVRTLHYHNGGSAAAMFNLTASLAHAAGGTTPPGMLQVTPSQITVPAGGTSDVTVTVNTRGDLPDGFYSGAIVATSGDVRVETAIAVDREVESFDIGVDALDEHGAPVAAIVFISPANNVPPIAIINGHGSFRLARGRYAIDAQAISFPGSFLAYPRFEADSNKSIMFDTRLARPIAVDVGDPTVGVASTGWQYIDYATFHSTGSFGFGFSLPGGQIGPDAPPDELVGMAIATQSDNTFGAANTVYNLAHSERGHLPTGWSATLAPDQITSVTAHHAGRFDAVYNKGALPTLVDPVQGLQGVGFTLLNGYDGPFDRVERFYAPGFLWGQLFLDNRFLPEQPGSPTEVSQLLAWHDYQPGQRIAETWNQAPYGPAFATTQLFLNGVVVLGSTASRTGDQLLILPSMFADAGSPAKLASTAFDHQRISLFRDGQLISELIDTDAFAPFDVPPGPATYRYEEDTVRPASIFDLSPHVTVAWTFRSQHVDGDQPVSLPLPTLRFSPTLDANNQTSAHVIVVPISFDRPPGAATPAITSTTIEASFDDGGHWSRVPVINFAGHPLVSIRNPGGAGFVSLRGSASDAQGNKIEQTIIRAFRFNGQ